MFTVVIPAYNAEKFINRAIDSVLNQTYKEYEIIVVNDGSSDKTKEIVSNYNQENIKVYNQENLGVSAARNKGIMNSTKNYICFLDADDKWCKNHLTTLAEMIKKYPEENLFITSQKTILLNQTAEDVKESIKKDLTINFHTDFFKLILSKNKPNYNTNCWCVKKIAFEKSGLFDTEEKIGEDTDMWYRLGLYNNVVYTNQVTTLRFREFSVATKHLQFHYDWVFPKKLKAIYKNPNISKERKESLKIVMNNYKITRARNFLLDKKKRKAFTELKSIDSTKNIKKRYFATIIFFLIPNKVLKYFSNRRFKNYYHEYE